MSDPATYPIIGVIGFAGAFCSGFGFWFLFNSKDIRIAPQHRHEIIRPENYRA
jgi:hypothetical protein